jgi:uncharacterized protein
MTHYNKSKRWKIMNFLLNNPVIKNKRGQIRSGWIILLVWAALYAITDLLSFLSIGLLQNLLSASGHYPSAGEQPDAVFEWVYNIFLPFYMQILYDLVMILTPIAAWCLVMKRSLSSMGLKPVKMRYKELYAGMFLGALCCFTVFFITVVSGQAVVESWVPSFSILQLWWLIVLIFVALGEEIINRGFLMSTLRRVGSLPFIVLVPSFIFGLIHLGNNGVTFFSVCNIILAGLLFSYMYIRSGNIWMCIGYHFTWNSFQGLVFGMPVSGINVTGMITTHFTADNFITGGIFGIEGGILTTLVTLLGFLFVKYYYRNSTYDFIKDV